MSRKVIPIIILLLSLIGVLYLLYISLVPIHLVDIKKASDLNTTYVRGELLEKSINICKKTNIPITINLELINGDIILLATKQSYGPVGCKTYIVSEIIPPTATLGEHALLITVAYPYYFREVVISLETDRFYIVDGNFKSL